MMLKDLADEYVEDPVSQFPVGRLVAGRVITSVCQNPQNRLKGRVELYVSRK